MTQENPRIQKVQALKEEFDAAFALPMKFERETEEKCFALQIDEDVFAIRFSQIRGLESGRKITSFPYGKSEFLGLAGINGKVASVYSLESLLGYKDKKNARWLALCGNKELLALAFDKFLGYVAVPRSDLFQTNQGTKQREYASGVFHYASKIGFIVDIESLLARLKT